MSILRFEGAQFKKAPGAVTKRGQISEKKIGFPAFLAQGKNLTPMQDEIKNNPKRVCPSYTRLRYIE